MNNRPMKITVLYAAYCPDEGTMPACLRHVSVSWPIRAPVPPLADYPTDEKPTPALRPAEDTRSATAHADRHLTF
jgi:hypothetical protein